MSYKEIVTPIFKTFTYFFNSIYGVIVGLIMTFFSYLLPILNIVQLVIFFFIVDMFVGYYSNKKIKGEKFSVKKIWENTIPRMTISLMLITCSYMWDTVFEQQLVSTYKIIGWFISGVILTSIANNGYKITKWNAFIKIGEVLKEKLKSFK